MYLMHSEEKSAVSERFIRTLKNRIYKYMTSILKKCMLDDILNTYKLDDIVHKYNNAYHSTTIMKPVDVTSNTYIDSSKEIKDKNPKFKLVILLEYQNIKIFLQKVTNWFEEVFMIKKVKNTVPWICVISCLKGEK